MAYVGTAKYVRDDRTTLASVLQGEARSGAPQIAVANVMMNRADVNFSGYGTSPVNQALGRLQFQGQVPVGQITPESYATADKMLNGTLERSLPDSLNYAAPVFSGPGATTAPWAIRALNSGEGVNVGGNVFFKNDRGGTPTYTPGATTNGSQTGVNTPGQTSGLTQNPDGSYTFTDNGDGTGSSSFPEIGAEAGANPAVRQGGSASATGTASSNAQTQNSQGQQTPRSQSSGGGGSAGGSMTVPMAIDAQTRGNASDTASLNSTSRSNTADLNKTATSNTESLNKTSTANTKSATDKAQGLYDAATGSLSDYFVRLVFIVVGLIALAAALMSFGKPKQLLQMAAKAL